ncbi:deoxyribodipyrimidine photo-lyase [Paenochrobactrum gallinarii]|uniref:Deoxyribodipyrimidine photo-lyase n=1 Tax=Paenochrobactrum gallinarii TaxID=643673 RepID=A0A841LUJ9_9HYPH|nr:deoxyribodipyrimidine photo-lyase [Paenochrobactrum gallinarii]MBB6262005.1 deoxyribodipyrimidine photo-lyase [Paenochrobactrum gallinarii]
MSNKILIWLRNDLRLNDNPALMAAMKSDADMCAIFIHEVGEGSRKMGSALRWWCENSLKNLKNDLGAAQIPLVVEEGNAATILNRLAAAQGFDKIYWNRRYLPYERDYDARIKADLLKAGIEATSFQGNLLLEPWQVRPAGENPYKVFGAYERAVRKILGTTSFAETGREIEVSPSSLINQSRNEDFWAHKFEPLWMIGEGAAQQKLDDFLSGSLQSYKQDRDRPDKQGTSLLSPHLRFGEISPRQIWQKAAFISDMNGALAEGAQKLMSELLWRDFHYYQAFYLPDIARFDMRDTLQNLHWQNDDTLIRRWQKGQTGIPIIDAGMRELWATGYMHNRVRMLVASFLTKNLMVDWRIGEEWFWDTLLDADAASNPGNWQWVAGCGFDAAPYFRVFNPVLQGQRFDAQGHYVRQWVPELTSMPDRWIHQPSDAPQAVLADAGVVLGQTYPLAMVNLKATQAAFKQAMKKDFDQPDLF